MNRFSKGFLLCVALPIGLGVFAALAFRWALKSDLARRGIQQSLSQALQMEVRFEKLRPTFFKGSRVSGLSASRPGGSSFTAREIYVRPHLASLLKGQFVLSDIRVEDPHLVFVETAGDQPPKPKTQHPRPSKNATASRLSANHLGVRNAAFEWIDSKGKVVLRVQGADLDLVHVSQKDAEGTLRIRGGWFKELIPFRSLESTVQASGGRYVLPEIHADSGGGALRAHLEVEPWSRDWPISLRARAEALDLAKMALETPALKASGLFNGTLQLEGRWRDPASFTGSAEASLQNGLFQGLALLQSIGQTFQIHELSQFRFDSVQAALTIADEKCRLESLKAEGGGLALSGKGTMDFDQQLALTLSLALPEKLLQGKVLSLFQDRFSPPDAKARRSITFEVNGTLDKPRMNLFERLVGDGVGQILDKVLGGFLKNKKAEPAPTPKDPPKDSKQR